MTTLRPRQVWGAGVLVAGVALLGIVAVAAEGRPLEGPRSSARLTLHRGWLDALVAAFVLTLLAGVALIVWVLLTQRQRTAAPPRARRRHWLVTAVALVVAFLVYAAVRPSFDDSDDPTPTEAATATTDDGPGRSSSPPPWAVLALGGVVVAALATALVAGRRLRLTDESREEQQAPLVDALDASIDELERDGDPRAAVIAAYARLLEGFERSGIGRRPAETPLEHLRRGLAALPMRPEPAERLTALFLEARFSSHPIGPAERDEARAALQDARDGLREQAAAVAGPSAT